MGFPPLLVNLSRISFNIGVLIKPPLFLLSFLLIFNFGFSLSELNDLYTKNQLILANFRV